MNYRKATILSETNLTPAGTKTIEINVADVISRLTIAWRVTKGHDGMQSYAHKDITKIELVDGSEVLHSLDGGQNQALCIYDRKCGSMNHGQHTDGNSEYSTYAIDFGRHLYDPVLALDPKRFKNLQLKIAYNFAVADTSATLGYMEVWADVFDEKVVTPMGFLTAKNYESWTLSAAGAYKYVDLPTDRVIRKMLIQGYYAAYEPWYQVIEARLSEENDKRIPFDLDLEDYCRVMKGVWTPVHENFYGLGSAASTYGFYVTPTDYYCTLNATGVGGAAIGPDRQPQGGYFKLTAAGGNEYASGTVTGFLPNHCFEIPFGNPQDVDDWYDVTKLGSLRLRLKSGSGSSGNVDTILQQLRKY
jgi:hypothetical protein